MSLRAGGTSYFGPWQLLSARLASFGRFLITQGKVFKFSFTNTIIRKEYYSYEKFNFPQVLFENFFDVKRPSPVALQLGRTERYGSIPDIF